MLTHVRADLQLGCSIVYQAL